MKIALKKSSNFVRFIIVLIFGFVLAFSIQASTNETNQNQQQAAQEKEFVSTLKAAVKAATNGPATIPLLNQATLKIPAGDLFIPKNEATAFMKANGNPTGPQLIGLILSRYDNLRWFITVNYVNSGYIRDGDAKTWTADSLMQNIKEDNETANKERIAHGFTPLEIIGWIQTPKYNALTHKLIWSMSAKDKGSNSDPVVNYKTYVLGREGYIKLNLVSESSAIEHDKLFVKDILSSLYFNQGKRYEDFNKSTDKVAEYGLAALITGIAAKKLGLFAILGAFLIKMWKLLLILPLLLLNWIKKLFGSNGNQNKNIDMSKD